MNVESFSLDEGGGNLLEVAKVTPFYALVTVACAASVKLTLHFVHNRDDITSHGSVLKRA